MPRPNYRRLDPVEPVEVPSRFSQTLLKHGNRCMRSAYLYLKLGSAPALQLDRGTAFHLWGEQVPWTLLQAGEEILTADLAEVMMNEVLDQHPELAVCAEDADALRVMAYHMAGDDRGRAGQRKPDGRPFPVGFAWRPAEIVAVERMWVLEVEGVRIVGKVDVAWLTERMQLQVRDYKTTLAMPKAEEFAGTFQTKLYGAQMLFGQPLNEQTGELEPSIGTGIGDVEVGEVYPRFLRRDDGTVQDRTQWFSRGELEKFVEVDVARLVRRFKAAFESWEFDAAHGSHCDSECPARALCPLPAALRQHAGEINSVAEAEEALEWAEVTAAKVSATRAEAKAFAKARGLDSIQCGTDVEYAFDLEERTSTDLDGLMERVEQARMFGQPFALAEVQRRSAHTKFKRRRRAA